LDFTRLGLVAGVVAGAVAGIAAVGGGKTDSRAVRTVRRRRAKGNDGEEKSETP
jgi:hypothetical protein